MILIQIIADWCKQRFPKLIVKLTYANRIIVSVDKKFLISSNPRFPRFEFDVDIATIDEDPFRIDIYNNGPYKSFNLKITDPKIFSSLSRKIKKAVRKLYKACYIPLSFANEILSNGDINASSSSTRTNIR